MKKILILIFISLPLVCFSQKIVYYSDTIDFVQSISSESYYKEKGDFEELVKSSSFRNVNWIVEQLLKVKETKRLNDYFIFEVLKLYSEEYFYKKNSHIQQAAFVYAVLNSMGFDLKIIFSTEGKYCIYVHTDNEVNFTGVLGTKTKKYYCIYPQTKSYSYRNEINVKQKSKRKFDFNILETPNMINSSYIKKELTFCVGKKIYKEEININKTLLLMYKNYPQMVDYCVNSKTSFSQLLKDDFEKKIFSKLNGITEEETVQNILSFCNSASKYVNDEKLYGKQRAQFPEEFLFESKADCEDYAIIFTYIVKEYTNISIVLIDYENHVDAAVCIPNLNENQKYVLAGEEHYEKRHKIKIEGKDYYICNPTSSEKANIGEVLRYDMEIGIEPHDKKYKILDCN